MGRNNRTAGSNSFKLRQEGVWGCLSRIRMGGHTMASHIDTGKEGREGRREGETEEGTKEKVKIKKIVLLDDSFVGRQRNYPELILLIPEPLAIHVGHPLPQNAVIRGVERHPTYRGLVPETHWNNPLLWRKECCLLTRVAMWVRVNSTCAPNSYDFNLFGVLSC